MRIIVFGDSIGWGAFDEQKGGWVERIKSHFMIGGQNEYRHGVYNFSVSGTQSRKILKSIDDQLRHFKDINTFTKENSLIIFAIGTNDSSYINSLEGIEVPLGEFKENMEKNIKIAQKYADNILVLGPLYVNEKITMPVSWYDKGDLYFTNDMIAEYAGVLEKVALEYGCSYCCLQSLIGNEDLDDGAHPNAQGHQKIAEKVLEKIEGYI